MDKLLVIVVTYNGMKWLDESFSSVLNSTVRADLFIVDNGSTDGSVDFIEKNYPDAKLIISNENLGFGKANNLGLQYAIDNNYDYVYLLNQDAWVAPDTFERLIKISRKNQDFGILSPLQTNREKTRLDNNFSKCCPFELLSDMLCSQPSKDIYRVDFVMAAHWLISIDVVKTVGGFSPVFSHYGEDLNYIDRVKFSGKKIGIAPSAYAVHDREYRVDSLQKKQYIFFVNNLAVLSNPMIKHRIFRVINNYLQTLFKDRRILTFSHLSRLMVSLPKIYRNRRKSSEIMAFLIK